MKLEQALEEYMSGISKATYLHAHLTNSCYDRCKHCYMNAVPECSKNSKHVDTKDLLHLVDIMRDEKGKTELCLSGGEPLLHPDIAEIMDYASGKTKISILTSGFGLSTRNLEKRKEILEALVRNNIGMRVESPNDFYHSITWGDVKEIRDFIKAQGQSPRRIGYPSRTADLIEKTLELCIPIVGLVKALDYILTRLGKKEPYRPYGIIPLGRGKHLPEDHKEPGVTRCEIKKRNDGIYVNPEGKIQYCLYSVEDGFMNISELREAKTKDEALSIMAQRLSEDITFQDMAEHGRCYFSRKIRKKQDI